MNLVDLKSKLDQFLAKGICGEYPGSTLLRDATAKTLEGRPVSEGRDYIVYASGIENIGGRADIVTMTIDEAIDLMASLSELAKPGQLYGIIPKFHARSI